MNKLDIEEDDPDFFKSFMRSKDLLTEVSITFSDDPHSIYFSLSAGENEFNECNEKQNDADFNKENSYLYKKL